MSYPKISIVTPSYNQGQYLEETILSVIGQNYPNLEYIIIDGGSTDGSIDVIKKYEKYITYWVTERDGGQAEAINKGFSKSTGEIMGWINSDDVYLPGILNYISSIVDVKQSKLIFGNSIHFNETEDFMWGSNVTREAEKYNITLVDYIIQPSCFWTRNAWESTGKLSEVLHYGFDWDWFIRAKIAGVDFKPTSKYLSLYRIHNQHKSGTGGDKRRRELISILEKYNNQKISMLCEDLAGKSEKIKLVEYYLKKLRLVRAEKAILTLFFPYIFKRYSYNLIKAVSRMV